MHGSALENERTRLVLNNCLVLPARRFDPVWVRAEFLLMYDTFDERENETHRRNLDAILNLVKVAQYFRRHLGSHEFDTPKLC
jgi:hypothetical protein